MACFSGTTVSPVLSDKVVAAVSPLDESNAAVSAVAGPSVVCAGMVVVDHVTPPMPRLPSAGELVPVDQLVLNIGGGAANTAVDLTRLGVPVSICARVGDDILGRFATETLVAHGVDVKALRSIRSRPTSQTLILNVRGEDRRFIHSLGANREFTAADMDAALDPPPRVLHIGYFLILPELDAVGLCRAFRASPPGGNQDAPGRRHARPRQLPRAATHPSCRTPTSSCPTTDEAELILGEPDPLRQALIFHDMGASRVVITQGEHGLISVSDEHRLRLGSYAVDFVDGSGGGDAFNAGYIVGLLEDRSELDCLKLASAVGASCVRAVGTTAGVFDREQAGDFLRRHPLKVESLA